MKPQPGKCCMCGKPIGKGDTYYKCTVSTCNSGAPR
jgi:hypothetical protein